MAPNAVREGSGAEVLVSEGGVGGGLVRAVFLAGWRIIDVVPF